jgi:uncharacterized repeat protein (TIGR01451 family)
MAINRISRLINRIRNRSERGAAAVEFAIGGGLLAVMAFGSAEYGLTLQKSHTLASAVRQASRVASTPCQPSSDCKVGNRPFDDYYTLKAAEAAMGEYWGQVRRVVIYKIVGQSQTKGDGGPPTECLTGTGKSLPSATPRAVYCNVYSRDTNFQLLSNPGTNLPLLSNLNKFENTDGTDKLADLKKTFGSDLSCGSTLSPPPPLTENLSRYFCPTSSTGSTLRPRSLRNPSRVGVFIDVDHKFTTGMFGSGRTLTQWDAFTLEPHPDDNSTEIASGGSSSSTNQFDLKPTLTDGVTSAQPGQTLTYTFTILNDGEQRVNNAIPKIYLEGPPPVSSWTCAPASACSATSGTGVTLGTVTLNRLQSATYTFSRTLPVTYSDPTIRTTVDVEMPPDAIDLTANTAFDVDSVPRPDLRIVKTNGVTTVAPGQTIAYNIEVTNLGLGNVPDARVTDTVDSTKLDTVSWTCVGTSGASCPSPSGSGNIDKTGPIPETGVLTYTLNARVKSDAIGTLSNQADVSTALIDPVLANNTSTDTDAIARPTMTVAKTIVGGAIAGTPIKWNVVVTNGAVPLNGVIITDSLPVTTPALTGGTWQCVATGSGTTCPAASGLLPLNAANGSANFGANGVLTYTVNAGIPSAMAVGTKFRNIASAMSPAPWNDSFTCASPGCQEATVTLPNLTVTNVGAPASGSTVGPGLGLKYTITAKSNAILSGVVLQDILPYTSLDNISWKCVNFTGSGNSCGTYATSSTSTTLNATLNYVSTGTYTFEVIANVKPGLTSGSLASTATLALAGAPTPAPTASWESNNNDNSVTVTNPISLPTVVLAKTVGDSTLAPSGTTAYTITARNTGATTATNVNITDPFPTHNTPVAGTPWFSSWSWTCSAPTGSSCATAGPSTSAINTTVTLAAGATATITVNVTVASTAPVGTITNTVSSTTGSPTLAAVPTPQSVTANVQKPDVIGESKSVTPTSGVGPGTELTYVIGARNNGPGTATSVEITDNLNTNLQYLSAVCVASTGSSCGALTATATGATTLVKQMATLLEGGTATVTIQAKVKVTAPAGSIANVANVTYAGETVTTNNTTPNAPVTVVLPVLNIWKGNDLGNLGKGSAVNYWIQAQNDGGGSITTTITDTLVGKLAPGFNWWCSDICTAPSGTNVNINQTVTLGPGQRSGYWIEGFIPTSAPLGPFTNTMFATRPSATTLTMDKVNQIVAADLKVTKTDSRTSVSPGMANPYTITIENLGPVDSTGATFADSLPTIQLTGGTWTCVATTGSVCPTLGSGNAMTGKTFSIKNGGTITITANTTVNTSATGTITNTATVTTATGQPDPDTTNNSGVDSNTAITQPDLSITKTNGTTAVSPNTLVTYTIVATNNGPGNVTGATVTDSADSKLSGLTWSCTPGSGATCPSPASGSGNLSASINLNSGSSSTFTFKGTLALTATGTLSNTATITKSGVTDPTPGDNTATDGPDTILGPNLKITKTSAKTSYDVGETVSYTIVVKNNGPAPTTGVKTTDPLPSLLTGLSASCAASGGGACGSGTFTGNTYNATSGTMPVGGQVTYTITGAIPATAVGPITNTATVTPPSGVTDPDTGDNSSTAGPYPIVTPDLAITTTSAAASYTAGTSLTYIVVATNNGPVNLNGVGIAATIPSPLTGATWTCTTTLGATCAGGSGASLNATVNMPSGSTITYTIVTQIPSTAPASSITSTATISVPAGVTDRNPSNNIELEVDAIVRPGGSGTGIVGL